MGTGAQLMEDLAGTYEILEPHPEPLHSSGGLPFLEVSVLWFHVCTIHGSCQRSSCARLGPQAQPVFLAP